MRSMYSLLFALTLALFLFVSSGFCLTLTEEQRAFIAETQQWKRSLTENQKKLQAGLLLSIQKREHSLPAALTHSLGIPELEADPSLSFLRVEIKVNDVYSVTSLIEEWNGEIFSSVNSVIVAEVPVDKLLELAELPSVKFICQYIPPIFSQGTVISEGDTAHRADTARMLFGADGSSTKVGVISDGVDALADLQTRGELPTVEIIPAQQGISSEGTAMLEIIHDLAPGADLMFATGYFGQNQFAENILALSGAGCDIIVDDLIYFHEPVFQDGVVAQAVKSVIENGTLYFSSAGNMGNKNDGTSSTYRGFFTPSSDSSLIHEFAPGVTSNRASDLQYVLLQWNDAVGASGNDYDVYYFADSGEELFSVDFQDGDDDPVEFLVLPFDVSSSGLIVVEKFGGDPRSFYLGGGPGASFQYSSPGAIFGHASASKAFAVAAVDVAYALGGSFNQAPFLPVQPFSSDGHVRIYWDDDGNFIADNFTLEGGIKIEKPDIAAADGVSTDTPGFDTFFGTSAAAPHAAAIASLMLSHTPGLSESEVREAFKETAIDIEASGRDRDSGYGLIDAIDLLTYIQSVPTPPVPSVPFVKLVCVEGEACHCSRSEAIEKGKEKGYNLCQEECARVSDCPDSFDLIADIECTSTTEGRPSEIGVCDGFYFKSTTKCVCGCRDCEFIFTD